MAITCPKCQSDNPDTLKFCGECGTQFPPSQDRPPAMTETLQTPVHELTTGSTFAGRYQIIEELGHGGMGRVYKVFDTKIKEKIALKLIRSEIASDKETIERFSNEIRLSRKIGHRNVCRMFDIGEAEGAHFIAMEYVHGEDLKSMIRMSTGLTVGTVLSVGKQICDGLAEAHSLGIVHRDLKPQNIMIDKGGNAKVMDFGIARSLKERGITGAGTIIGTPEYMSPEQAEAKETDARSDIYSLGIILYEMATGRVPFEGDSALSIAMKHKGEMAKAPNKLNPHLPDDLSSVILKCLEKDRNKRYQSISDLHAELDKIEKGIPTTERVIPEKKPMTSRKITVTFRLRRILVPAAIGLTILSAAIVVFFANRGPAYDPKRIIVSVFENQTGDKSLEPLGRMASDWINQGLSKTGLVEVVSVPPGEGAPGTAKENERIRALAKESGAGTLVSGTYFLQGKALSFHSQINDMSKGRVIKALDPVSGPVEEPLIAIETLRQKVMGSLAAISDPRMANLSASMPSYEAYKEYMTANELWMERYDMKGAIQHLSRASELDPSFMAPVLSAAVAHYNLGETEGDPGEFAKADELARKVDNSREVLSPQEKLNLDWVKANLRGDQAEELRITRQLDALVGGGAWKFPLAMEAMRSNCPREAIRILSKLDPAGVFMKGWTPYWGVMTMSYHMLGEHKQELKQARRGRKQYPEDISVLAFEVGALAALGKIEEVNKLIDEIFIKPEAGWNAAAVMLDAGLELKLHGFRKESLELLERAVKWLESRPSEEKIQTKDFRSMMAGAYYMDERWEDARTLFEGLLKDNPENPRYIAACGLVAARRGDKEEALRMSKQLEDMKKPYRFGKDACNRACIASVLGEKDVAVRLLQEAISQGYYFDSLYIDIDLELLRDYPPFKELMKPKG